MWTPCQDCLQRQFYNFILTDHALFRVCRNYFRTATFYEKLRLHSKHFRRAATSPEYLVREQLLSQSSYIFRTPTSSQQLFFSKQLLIRSEASTDQLLLVNWKLFRQLVFQNSYFLGRQNCSEYQFLQKSFFFEGSTSKKQKIFQNNYFYKQN